MKYARRSLLPLAAPQVYPLLHKWMTMAVRPPALRRGALSARTAPFPLMRLNSLPASLIIAPAGARWPPPLFSAGAEDCEDGGGHCPTAAPSPPRSSPKPRASSSQDLTHGRWRTCVVGARQGGRPRAASRGAGRSWEKGTTTSVTPPARRRGGRSWVGQVQSHPHASHPQDGATARALLPVSVGKGEN